MTTTSLSLGARLVEFYAQRNVAECPAVAGTHAAVWKWFDDAGCFIGDSAACLTDPARTPFARLLYVPADGTRPGFIALRLLQRAHTEKRIRDRKERIPWDFSDPHKNLAVYALCGNKPELFDTVDDVYETELRAEFGARVETWV